MTIPLATYTAEKGLDWFYDKSVIGFAELDRCRRLLDSLPDFDAGDNGYEGAVAVGGRVYVIRCANALKWDFMGRDATYLIVTWFPRRDAATIDIEKILGSTAFTVPTHEHRHSFVVECAASGANDAWTEFAQKLADERLTVFAKREIGQKNLVVTVNNAEGGDKMTEAEKFFSGKEQPLSSAEHVATGGTAVESQQFSMGMRILGVVLFIVLILLGTYLAKIAGHILFGFIVGAGAFSILRVLWWVRKE